ncbi:MAG: Asp23/Gls24 family envelope stress response protein [Lachnospiraceae bacterium]|nr:Asp23/Gls24 family envelope stress response protein [Lachnospiraceae bacterium]
MDNRSNYILREDAGHGNVYLAEDVVAMIAGLAAIRDVDGVTAVGDSTKKSLASQNVKKAARGVKVEINEGIVNVDISLAISYGYNIPETCRKVQTKVQSNIENMTGLKVAGVNLRIAGLNMN